MKSILTVILIGLISITSAATVDERKSDIYFGNGILTTKLSAQDKQDKLYKVILKEVYSGDTSAFKHNHGEKVNLSYNWTAKEDYNNELEPVAMVLDILESHEQLTGFSTGWSALTTTLQAAITAASTTTGATIGFVLALQSLGACRIDPRK